MGRIEASMATLVKKMHQFFDACTHAIDWNAVEAHTLRLSGDSWAGQATCLTALLVWSVGCSGSSYTSRGFLASVF